MNAFFRCQADSSKHGHRIILATVLTIALVFSAFLFSPVAHAASRPISPKGNIHTSIVRPLACQPEIGYGSTGTTVMEAQEDLNVWYEIGIFNNTPYNFHPYTQDPSNPLAVDGIFGNNTYNATRDFQKAKGLTADGIIGPQTWHVLFIGASGIC